MQNSTSKEYGELITLQDARRKDTWTPPTKSWWTLEEWIKSWRSTMKNSGDKKDDEIKLKDERIRWALRWFRWRFRRNGWGNWTPEKKRWKHLELEFIHQEQTPKERITHLDEIRIRFIVCLSFIKLNWWPTMDFCILLILVEKELSSDISKTWEGLHEPPVGLKRTNELSDKQGKRILNEPP